MRYLCDCGANKPAPPYRSNLVVPFICTFCRSRGRRPQVRGPIVEVDKVILIKVTLTKRELFRKFTRKSS